MLLPGGSAEAPGALAVLFPPRAITVKSDSADGGDDRVDYAGTFEAHDGSPIEISAQRQVLRRALRTVLDGTGFAAGLEAHPMVDFEPGTERTTVLDGFTVQHLPSVDHTIPGHAHTLECRGTSPTIRNNIVRFNGSTGIGVHATFGDGDHAGPVTDYRLANAGAIPSPLIEDNVVHHSQGMGLGNNHYSRAEMRGNEVFDNRALHADDSAAGIGSRHGARPVIEDNLVYRNGWGGIVVHQGVLQGEHPIDVRTSAVIRGNEVLANGDEGAPAERRISIGVDGVGTEDDPVIIEGNVSRGSPSAGIGVRNEMSGPQYAGDDTWVRIVGNTVEDAAQAGIACIGSAAGTTHCHIERNVVTHSGTSGVSFGGQGGGAGPVVGAARHNTVAFNGAVGLRSQAGQQVEVRNNLLYANAGPGLLHPTGAHDHNGVCGNNGVDPGCGSMPFCVNPQYGLGGGGQGQGAGDVGAEPAFVDADGGDFSLSPGSPAIDAGADLGAPFHGAAPDLGALEMDGG